MKVSTFLLLFTLSSICALTSSAVNCPHMHYFNRASGECTPCSACKPDQVPHRQCYGDKDTKCGAMPPIDFGQHSSDNVVRPVSESSGSPSDHQQTATTMVVTDQNNEDKWFTITMILVCVLVLTCIIGVVAVLVFCVAYKQKQREIMRETGKAF